MAKILVIDDENAVHLVFEHVLSREGHVVLVASNGDEGIALYCTEEPDLVITDMDMPEKDGEAVILEIKALVPDQKIIAMSASGRHWLLKAREAGADFILTRPFELPDVVDVVRECLGE